MRTLPITAVSPSRRVVALILCGLTFALLVPETLKPCGGTPRPPTCDRTIWLGKSVPKIVAIEPDGGATIELVLLPYIAWGSSCPAPNAATLSVTIRCVSVSTGASTTLGPLNVSVNVPTVPGQQTLANGTNRMIQTIAAGQLDPNDRYICTIVGSYSVTFPSTRIQPIPSPTITGGGDATMCLVPSSVVRSGAGVPELNVRHISPNNAPYLTCRRGDQAVMHFLIENNRTDRSVTLNFESFGRQTSRLPVGFADPQAAFDSAVYAISSPVGGTDVFPAAFTDQMIVGEIIPDGDPMEVDPQRIERTITLAPCESRVVSIAVRSHGMCADGSCNERDVVLRGRWSNGDTAIGCASTMLLVDTRSAKTPLCEVKDDIAVSDSVQAEFSPAQMIGPNGPIEHATTHYAGNLPPRTQRRGTVLAGDSVPLNFPSSSSASDYVRIPDTITGMKYRVVGRPLWFDLVPFENIVTIENLSGGTPQPPGTAVEVPLIYGNVSDESYDVMYNAADDSITIAVQGDPIYEGTLSGLIANPPRGWRIDEGTSRTLQKVENPWYEAWVWTDPTGIGRLLRSLPGRTYGDEIDVYDGVRKELTRWTANVTGTGVSAPSSGEATIPLTFDLSAVDPFPATSLNWVNVSIPTTGVPVLNAPQPVPVVLRKKELPTWVREIRVAQIDFRAPEVQKDSRNGLFTVRYDPQPEARYVNVLARPTVGREREPVWLVRNLLLPPFTDANQMLDVWIDLGLIGVEDGENLEEVEIDLFFDIIPYLREPEPLLWTPIDVDDRIHWLGPGGLLSTPPTIPLEPVPTPVFTGPDTTTWVYRGCRVPNHDLDSSSREGRLDTNYAGDWNACGPVAAANSMQWLGQEHPELRLSSSLRQKLRELSRMMGRGDTAGVNTRMLIQGKLAFIDAHKLPIRVKFQGFGLDTADVPSPDTTYGHSARNDNDTGTRGQVPKWSWLVQEMKDGEDVELKYGCYDSSGNRLYGHWITMTGVSEINGARGIYYKDDWKQGDTGGTSQRFATWDTSSSGYPMLTGMSNPNRRYYVEGIVAESYDTTVTFPVEPTENIGIRRFDFAQPFRAPMSILGQVTWTTEPSEQTQFLNVYARRTRDDQPVWLVQNMILPPFPESEEIAYWVNFELLGVLAGRPVDSLWLLPELGDEVVVSFQPGNLPDRWEHHGVDRDLYVVANGAEQVPGDPTPTPGFRYPGLPRYNIVTTPDSVYRGCTVPNIDLDSMRNRPGNGYAGDWNACAPAAAANSLHWLEQTHAMLDSTSTHREKLRELSEMMGRAARGGVIDEDFIKGKLAFIDRHKLPIKVKFQTRWRDTADIPSPDTTGRDGNPERGGYGHEADNRNDSNNAEPTWDFLVQEMKAGEDVELVVQWNDSLGRGAGAHVVVVTGVSNANGMRRLWYKDDRRQDTAGGMQQPQVTWDTANGRPIIRELGMHDTLAYVTIIYSESYDSTVRFDTIAGPSDGSVRSDRTGERGLDLTVIRNPSDSREPIEVAWRLDAAGTITLRVYDASGRLVRSLRDERAEAGAHRLVWRGDDDQGELLSAGVYLLVLRQGDQEGVVRVVRY